MRTRRTARNFSPPVPDQLAWNRSGACRSWSHSRIRRKRLDQEEVVGRTLRCNPRGGQEQCALAYGSSLVRRAQRSTLHSNNSITLTAYTIWVSPSACKQHGSIIAIFTPHAGG